MGFCSVPRPKRCWRWPLIPNGWGPESAFWPCSTPGANDSKLIHISTVSCPPRPQPDQRDVTGCRGVHPPFPDACPAQRIRQDPALRISLESNEEGDGAALPQPAPSLPGPYQSALPEGTTLSG